MTIEFARNVLGYEKANSMEFDTTTAYPVISLMEEQKNVVEKGGTMRLGAWKCTLKSGSKLAEIYDSKTFRSVIVIVMSSIVNSKDYEDRGLVPTGFNPDTGLVEALELNEHPFYIGVQYHPEYKSTVATPHPLFKALVKAAVEHKGK